jgi:membrane protease YdiL (CAAX protease family)
VASGTCSYDDAVPLDEWPAPTGCPIGTSGWYLASDGQWYRSDTAPMPGFVLGPDGRWTASEGSAWLGSRWGLGDVWIGAVVYLAASIGLALAVFAVGTAVQNASFDEIELGPYSIAFLVVGNVVAFAGVPWLATRRKGLRSLARDFGLRFRPIDLAIGLGFGVAGLVVAAVAGTAIDTAFGVEDSTSNVPVDSLRGPGEVIVFFLAVAVVTPVIEELFFRGLVYRSFSKRGMSTTASIAAATAVFVLPHLTAASDLASLVSLAASIGVLGVSFNLACRVTNGRLGAAIVAHLVVNGAAVIALAVT